MTKNIRLPFKILIIILIEIIVLYYPAYPQKNLQLSAPDSLKEKNYFLLGTEKLVSMILFNANGNIEQDLPFGIIRINQLYRGSSIKSIGSDFRDDELLNIDYNLNIYKSLFAVARASWLYSSSSKEISLNKFERLFGTIGLRQNFFNSSFAEISAGRERNVQVGQRFLGYNILYRSVFDNLSVMDYTLNSGINGEYARYDKDRINSDFDGKFLVSRKYDSNNAINLSLKYKVLNGDYFNPPVGLTDNGKSFENRFEERLFADFNLDFSVTNYLLTNFQFSYSTGDVSRQYKNVIPEIIQTKVIKTINDNSFLLSEKIRFVTDIFSQSLMMSYSGKNEINRIKKKDFLLPSDEVNLQSLESYSDYNYTTTSLFTQSRLNITKRDVLILDYTVSVYRYDTPSKSNYYDKDEFSSMAILSYFKKLNQNVSIKLKAELNMNHYVNLMAQRSSENAWRRIIQLSPQIFLNYDGFSMEPQFSVMANYFVYDFSGITPGERSYSLREISYRDTIYIRLPEQFSIGAKFISRYHERGILYWKEFAESVQNSNFEQFAKLLLFLNLKSNIFVGFGTRFFYILQKMKQKTATGGLPDYKLLSGGPELSFRAVLSNNSSVNISGWYEFQKTNSNEVKSFPNIMISTNIRF